MMKKITLIAFTFIAITSCQLKAQEPTFQKGNKVLNASIGLGSVLYSGIGYSTQVPPIALSLELGVKDDLLTENLSLGLGGYLGYSKNKWDYSYYNYGWTYTNIVIGGRVSAHYPILDKLDTYGGMMIGFNIVSSKEYGVNNGFTSTANGSGLVWATYIGGRYYLTPKIAVLGEIGYGIAWLNFGVSFKF